MRIIAAALVQSLGVVPATWSQQVTRSGGLWGQALVGRSFDVDDLWICDNSVFPSALAANPALTIVALALRTAETFLAGSR